MENVQTYKYPNSDSGHFSVGAQKAKKIVVTKEIKSPLPKG